MFKTSQANFEKLLDKATSLTNLEPDWNSILQICDAIRQNDVQPRYALNAIKKKLNATNPNVQLMALQVLESCVKNCGAVFHYELATREFMEELHAILKSSSDAKVKNEILRLVQAWAHAFRKEQSFKAVQDQMRLMKAEGFQFPAFKESDIMYNADTAPIWTDGECCHRCRMDFSLIIRKHHCRACGQVFCGKCSAKTSTIPKFGIEKEVRVCDHCFEKINKKIEIKASPTEVTKPKVVSDSTNSSHNQTTPVKTKTEQEIQEEEELQLALALSKSEAETKEYEKMRNYGKQQQSKPMASSGTSTGTTNNTSSTKVHRKNSKSGRNSALKTSTNKKSTEQFPDENEDSELARYLNREYWEQRAVSGGGSGSTGYGDYENSPSPSAPQVLNNSASSKLDSSNQQTNKLTEQPAVAGMQDDQELETFTKHLRSTIEIFVNRLNSNKLRGRPITLDNGVQAVFMNLTNMHSHLMMYMTQTSEARSNCERLQDKINQIRDARAALDALRDEHREQLKRMAAEAELIRQQQMAQKLEIMRKKKQEYLQYQRELALQRMQEQERELMMRTEQYRMFASASAGASGVPPPTSANLQWNSMNPPLTTGPYAVPGALPNQMMNSNYYPGTITQQPHVAQTPGMAAGQQQPTAAMMNPAAVQGQYGTVSQPMPPPAPTTMVAPMLQSMVQQPPQPTQSMPIPTVHGGMIPQHYVSQQQPPPPPPMHQPQTHMYMAPVAHQYPQVTDMTPNPQQQSYPVGTIPQEHQQQQLQQPQQSAAVVKEELLINFD